MTEQLLGLAVMVSASQTRASREHLARLAARLGYIAIHVPPALGSAMDDGERSGLIASADPASVVFDGVLDGELDAVGILRFNDLELVSQARQRLDAIGEARPLIVAVPVSIGRTIGEASARADHAEEFVGAGHPEVSGIFGTFEQAQAQVLALARAGADVLLISVPDAPDIADLLAQVRALVVGPTPALFRAN